MKKDVLFGESIFVIASYNLVCNFRVGGKNTKRTIEQMNVIVNYVDSIKIKEKNKRLKKYETRQEEITK